ncbi:Hypothetical protein CINCED_3A013515 [Cinara cedri]|uniref:Ig-like domain-containing protein n=3 Tax=Cinara cedri TaxID=506608 RepID=A0A5E4MS36_9HEMI|nr:Hypothetical protein CINCED_3A013515 [Cinara cedri]
MIRITRIQGLRHTVEYFCLLHNNRNVQSFRVRLAVPVPSRNMTCWNSLNVILYSVVICALLDFGPSRVLAQVNIKANYDYGDKFKVAEYKMKVVLNCNVAESTQDQKYLWKWFKEEDSINTDSDDPHHVSVSDNTLTINRFVENDAGKYSCKLYNQNNPKELGQKSFQVVLKPYLKLPKTATFLDGDKIEIECNVFGVPKPEISWKFENNTILTGDNVYFMPNKRNITNAILVLDPITMKNRGNFYCIGKNDFVWEPVMSGPSYVRIKDKMAAFWPFLGICAEVIILCLIIFVYENKRFKSEFEESDTDQGPETNNAIEGGGDVRHRK